MPADPAPLRETRGFLVALGAGGSLIAAATLAVLVVSAVVILYLFYVLLRGERF